MRFRKEGGQSANVIDYFLTMMERLHFKADWSAGKHDEINRPFLVCQRQYQVKIFLPLRWRSDDFYDGSDVLHGATDTIFQIA